MGADMQLARELLQCDVLSDARYRQPLEGAAMCQKRIVKQVSWGTPVSKTIEFDPADAPFCGHEFVVAAGWRAVVIIVAAAVYVVWLTSNLK